jgi:magnesium-transporting ATPase (P-type)
MAHSSSAGGSHARELGEVGADDTLTPVTPLSPLSAVAVQARAASPARPSALLLSRTVTVLGGAESNPQPKGGNRIRTTRFTWWNFVVLFLLEQFDPRRKFANFYFLVICVLQSLDAVSITNSYPVALNALAFVIFVQLVVTLKETISRCANDRRTNSCPVGVFVAAADGGEYVSSAPGSGGGAGSASVWAGGAFQQQTWADVRVGDVVKVGRGECFPADLVLLATSDHHGRAAVQGVANGSGGGSDGGGGDDGGATTTTVTAGGFCFINTCNLDGETNHKVRRVPVLPRSAAKHQAADGGGGGRKGDADDGGGDDKNDDDASTAACRALAGGWAFAELRCEAFNSKTSEFTATATITTGTSPKTAGGTGPVMVPLDVDNLLPRGCSLVDTEWVLGIVVAVGSTTKSTFQEPANARAQMQRGMKLVRARVRASVSGCLVE